MDHLDVAEGDDSSTSVAGCLPPTVTPGSIFDVATEEVMVEEARGTGSECHGTRGCCQSVTLMRVPASARMLLPRR